MKRDRRPVDKVPISKRGLEILALMEARHKEEAYEDAEIVCDGIHCWLGDVRVHRRTVSAFLSVVAVSRVSEPGSVDRFSINGTGRSILKDLSVVGRVQKALREGYAIDQEGYRIASDGRRLPENGSP